MDECIVMEFPTQFQVSGLFHMLTFQGISKGALYRDQCGSQGG